MSTQFRMEMCCVGHFYPQMLTEHGPDWEPNFCPYCIKEGNERLMKASKQFLIVQKSL